MGSESVFLARPGYSDMIVFTNRIPHRIIVFIPHRDDQQRPVRDGWWHNQAQTADVVDPGVADGLGSAGNDAVVIRVGHSDVGGIYPSYGPAGPLFLLMRRTNERSSLRTVRYNPVSDATSNCCHVTPDIEFTVEEAGKASTEQQHKSQ